MNLFAKASRLIATMLFAGLWLAGCSERSPIETIGETDDPIYNRAKDLLARGLENEALENYLKLIQKRNGNAPESYLDAGNIYLNHLRDPETAIFYFRRYQALVSRDGSPEAKERLSLVDDLIKTARKEFAATLDMKVYQDPLERLKLLDTIQQLREENETLKRQLTDARNRLSGYMAATPIDAGTQTQTAPPQTTNANAAVVRPAPPRSTPTAAATTQANVRQYTIKAGDSLYQISREAYGDGNRWRDIVAANRDAIPDPKNLKVGTVIVLP